VTKPLIFLEISLTRIWKPAGRNPKKKADAINKVVRKPVNKSKPKAKKKE
jgi:hypothetical protein